MLWLNAVGPTRIGVHSEMECMQLMINRSSTRIQFQKIQDWIFKPKFNDQDQGSVIVDQGSKIRSRIKEWRSRIQSENQGSKFPL